MQLAWVKQTGPPPEMGAVTVPGVQLAAWPAAQAIEHPLHGPMSETLHWLGAALPLLGHPYATGAAR